MIDLKYFGGNKMKKAQKQDILDMIQTLHEAHEEIKSYIDKKNYALAQDILSQCQECAISIGTAIEKSEGEGFVTVSYVEAYCDAVFHCYEELNGSEVNANKIYKNLRKQLLRIESSVRNDVPIRKEIAFFPYKASMWDALESVYLAAKEDPDCDAYCVPIPYYDRNPDRSLGAMHYEGLEYPKNIEVIDWQTYNFEKRRPDAIYIHNPYDDWNLVTCVHPRYFSNNLKKYTDKLIYIPYFVLGEIEPDDQRSIDNMKHFIWTPGVINADKVIVQSEKMKQIYVNEYLKAAQANGLQGKHIDRKCLEEKFLGLGSPKFDKVLNTKKEDLEIPEEWLKIIEKPDGSWKKIIFYNTSIGALLQYNEKMLEKMKDVFRIFKENRDEVALLWRPHPLIKTTVSSMRPQLWVEYEKLVRQYREEGWGIYDDSSDMDRAVVLSDAYYGDQSSVVQVYQQTGKSVMIQNVDVQYCHGRFPISFDCTYQEGNDIWFVGINDNSLWNMDLSTKKITYVEVIPTDGEDTYRMNTRCIKNQNNIVCLPDRDDKIVIYDTDTGNFKNCKINVSAKQRLGIYNGWKRNGVVWCVSYFLQQIIKINLYTMTIEGAYNVFKDASLLMGYEAAMSNGNIYCISRNDTVISKFNIETEDAEYYKLPINEKGLNTIAADGDIFYMTGYKKAIYIWDQKMNQIRTLDNFPEQYTVCKNQQEMENGYCDVPIFYRSIVTENCVLLLPWNFPEAKSNGLILYDKRKQEITFISQEVQEKNKDIIYFMCYHGPQNEVGLFCTGENKILEICEDGHARYLEDFTVVGSERLFADIIQRNKTIVESDTCNLKNLLKNVLVMI